MKKLIIIPLLFLCVATVFAGTYYNNLSSKLQLNGYVNEYCFITITPLFATETSGSGLPFNISANDVAYGSPGRNIATWSMATNATCVNLSILSEPLYLNNDVSKLLNYYLDMNYRYVGQSEDTGNSIINSGTITVHSGGAATEVSFPLSGDTGGIPIVSTDQDILLVFDEDATSRIPSMPDGMYYGNVIITMEAL